MTRKEPSEQQKAQERMAHLGIKVMRPVRAVREPRAAEPGKPNWELLAVHIADATKSGALA